MTPQDDTINPESFPALSRLFDDDIPDDWTSEVTPRQVAEHTFAKLSESKTKSGDPAVCRVRSLELERMKPLFLDMGEVGHLNVLTGQLFVNYDGEDHLVQKRHDHFVLTSGFERLDALFGQRAYNCSDDNLDGAMMSWMSANRVNPFRDWLESLPPWDGVPRIRSFFKKTCGAHLENYPDAVGDAYAQQVWEALLTGAVARQFGPRRLEIVPYLIGPQGGFKTTAVSMLAPSPEFFKSTAVPLSDRQKLRESIAGAVVVEFGEGTGLRCATEAVKQYLSDPSDTYRPPYALQASEFPRYYMAIATVNDREPFTDPTGARRFFPFDMADRGTFVPEEGWDLSSEVDRRRIVEEEVPRIWAEALYLYRSGAKTWIDTRAKIVPEYDVTFMCIQEGYSRANAPFDIIEGRLADWAAGRGPLPVLPVSEFNRIISPGLGDLFNDRVARAINAWRSDPRWPTLWKKCKKRPNGDYRANPVWVYARQMPYDGGSLEY